jgi:ribosomal protein S12 methylthiotransferase accessory factor
MFANIKRPYKERSAESTVEYLRDILQNTNLLPEETFHANPYPEIFSLSIELPTDKGAFRTNGKGRTETYCRASAYAEFMERLQNGLYGTFSRTNQRSLFDQFGFYYAPDEQQMTKDEFLGLPREILTDIIRYSGNNREGFVDSYFQRIASNGGQGAISVPFWDTKSRIMRQLPYNLLLLTVGSNGMAAGNTPSEAVFQALCELLERWGASLVFYNRLTPPTVPDEYLRQFDEEYAIIERIQKSGKYRVTIKDFSAGRRIPTVGIIISNTENKTYRLNVGSDTCFQVALSRCLTEIYQGFSDEKQFDGRLLPLPTEISPYFKDESTDAMYMRYFIFGQFCKDNSGVFPQELFGSTPSYEFDPSTFTSRGSYDEEVKYLINFFHQAGHNVYIRDVGFLGFPSVFVYVPEVSAQGRKNVTLTPHGEKFDMIELDKIEQDIFSASKASLENLVECATVLERFAAYGNLSSLFNIKMPLDKAPLQPPLSFVLTLLWYRIGDYKRALEHFNSFIAMRNSVPVYYTICCKILELLCDGHKFDSMRERLKGEFAGSVDDVDRALNDLENGRSILSHAALPECPNCDQCPISRDCLTKGQLTIARTVYPLMKKHFPLQENIVTFTMTQN